MTTVADAAVLVASGAGLSILPKATLVLALLDSTQRRGRVGMAPRGRVSPVRGQILYFNIPGHPIQGRIWYFDWRLLKYKI